jgi:hypothetical protein
MPRTSEAINEPLEAIAAPTPRKKAKRKAKRKTPVRSHRNTFDSMDYEFGQDETRRMKSTGPAEDALIPPIIEPVEGPVSKSKLDELQFQSDILEVEIHETRDKNDVPLPDLIINGKHYAFFRGVPRKVPRFVVSHLAKMRATSFSCRKTVDVETGFEEYIYPATTSPLYPFAVLHDPAGQKGRDWLDKIRQER